MADQVTRYRKSFVELVGTIQQDYTLTLLEYTETPLGASATFTSSTYQYDNNPIVSGICYADQDGTLVIELSPDGTKWIGETAKDYTANDKLNFRVYITAPYFRVRFINGSTAQSFFYLYIYSATS